MPDPINTSPGVLINALCLLSNNTLSFEIGQQKGHESIDLSLSNSL
jgi:hypothetical protein